MPYVAAPDGTSLFYTSFGHGPPLVLVHSWGFNSDMWNYQVPALRLSATES